MHECTAGIGKGDGDVPVERMGHQFIFSGLIAVHIDVVRKIAVDLTFIVFPSIRFSGLMVFPAKENLVFTVLEIRPLGRRNIIGFRNLDIDNGSVVFNFGKIAF